MVLGIILVVVGLVTVRPMKGPAASGSSRQLSEISEAKTNPPGPGMPWFPLGIRVIKGPEIRYSGFRVRWIIWSPRTKRHFLVTVPSTLKPL